MKFSVRLLKLRARLQVIELGFKSGITKGGLEWTIKTPIKPGVRSHFPKHINVRDPALGGLMKVTKNSPREATLDLLETPIADHGTMRSARAVRSVGKPLFANFKKNKVAVSYVPVAMSPNKKGVQSTEKLGQHYDRLATRAGFKVNNEGFFTRLEP